MNVRCVDFPKSDPQSGLTLNVIKPANVDSTAKLPVAVVSCMSATA
jgi:hypothetical protein